MDREEMKEGDKKGVREVEGQDVLVSRKGGTLALKTCHMEFKAMGSSTPMSRGRSRWVFTCVTEACGSFFVFHFLLNYISDLSSIHLHGSSDKTHPESFRSEAAPDDDQAQGVVMEVGRRRMFGAEKGMHVTSQQGMAVLGALVDEGGPPRAQQEGAAQEVSGTGSGATDASLSFPLLLLQSSMSTLSASGASAGLCLACGSE